MEQKVKVVFAISKLKNVIKNEIPSWLEFVKEFIKSNDIVTNFYFILDFENDDMRVSDPNNIANWKAVAEKISNYLKENKIDFKKNILNFGLCLDPVLTNDDQKNILFYSYLNPEQKISLDNSDSIFFFNAFELDDFLTLNGYFIYFLNFDEYKVNDKKAKRICKDIQGYIDSSNYSEFSFSNINYQFLTFLEQNKS